MPLHNKLHCQKNSFIQIFGELGFKYSTNYYIENPCF